MRFADILKMCFDSLSRRKGRTILTVLGVFIGCTSIIVMVSIGAGMQESLRPDAQKYGRPLHHRGLPRLQPEHRHADGEQA
ncbi:MAG: ABC transporter permease [Oscillibacter sp.]